MNIAIQSSGLVLTESLRAYVYRRLETSLGWALTRKLAVWLSDINGPRGGRDKRCKIQISLDNGKTVVIEDTEDDMYVAIDRAAERADRALARQLSRSRAFTHDKVTALAPVDAAVTDDDVLLEDTVFDDTVAEDKTSGDKRAVDKDGR